MYASFSRLPNCVSVESWSWSGRRKLFQSSAALAAKLRGPKMSVLVVRTVDHREQMSAGGGDWQWFWLTRMLLKVIWSSLTQLHAGDDAEFVDNPLRHWQPAEITSECRRDAIKLPFLHDVYANVRDGLIPALLSLIWFFGWHAITYNRVFLESWFLETGHIIYGRIEIIYELLRIFVTMCA